MRSFTVSGARYLWRGTASLAAGTALLLSISVQMSFSNLNTYIISYMRARTNPELTYADFIYISQVQNSAKHNSKYQKLHFPLII